MNRRWLPALCLLALALPAGAGAQALEDYDYENLRFRGVGFALGSAWPSKVEETTLYSLRFDLGYLGPGVRVAPSVTYWSSTMKRTELLRLASQLNEFGASVTADNLGPIDWSNLALNLDGHFVWTTPIDVYTYAGAGLGLHMLNGRGAAIEDTFVEDLLDSITAGVSAIGGLEYQPVDRLRLYGEARYTLMTDLHYASVRLGAALMFPGPPGGAGDTTVGAGAPGERE